MNYLAHLALSGADSQIRMGNLMGDFTTGRLTHERFAHLPSKIRLGLALHRWIDEVTDHDPRIGHLVDTLRPDFGKWAPLVLDIMGDYFIQRNWPSWGLGPWDVFEKQVYHDLEHEYEWAPSSMKPMLDSLLTYRWLSGYGTVEGIVRAVQSVQRRAQQPIPTQAIPHWLLQDSQAIRECYGSVFHDLLSQSEHFIQTQRSRYP